MLYMGVKKYRNAGNKRLYKIWWHMVGRCEDLRHISYKNYGERGIVVCKEWHDFDLFADWAIDNGYNETLEIDRIDNNDEYKPSNCRWVTRLENARNKRTTKHIDVNGVKYTYGKIADIMGIPTKLAWQKINRDGYDVSHIIDWRDATTN